MTRRTTLGAQLLVSATVLLALATIVLGGYVRLRGLPGPVRVGPMQLGQAASDEGTRDGSAVGRAVPAPPSVASLTYTIAPGDTLSVVAERYGTTVEALMDNNGIRNPDAVYVGQEIQLWLVPERDGPAIHVVPDSELVYGPAYLTFDTPTFITAHPGHLNLYSELVNGEEMSGPEIVDTIARDFSVGPRVLLAFVEARGGWVTGTPTEATALDYPAGMVDPFRSGLWRQLSWLADRLNGGYYDWKTRGHRVLRLADGTALAGHPSLGPGSFAVHRALALQSTEAQLSERLLAFTAAYQALFGDPWPRELPPPDLTAASFPTLQLPWARGERWWFTGGPHGGWADGSAWSALDFVPDDEARGCFESVHWSRAVAAGVIVDAGPGQIWLDLDGDGRRETGPAVLYLHIASDDRVKDGTRVKAGDRLGHPSCEGGSSNATHVHLARTYDGEWLAADGPVPFVLSGWNAVGTQSVYDGRLVHLDGREREACECREEDYNDLSW